MVSSSMIGYAAFITFISIWASIAAFARRRSQSMTIAIGGGFLASCVALAALGAIGGMFVSSKVGRTSNATQASMKRLFDISIPQVEREKLAREFVIGEFHGNTPFGPINYTISSDGTWFSSWCVPYGELSERKFTPNGKGTWVIREQRYRDTGMIYYAVQIESMRTGLLLDRDAGVVIYNGGEPPSRTFPGHTTRCGTE